MTESTNSFERNDLKNHVVLDCYNRDVTPSWKSYGEGSQGVDINAHISGRWLAINAFEYALADPFKKNSRATTMRANVTLDRNQAIALRDMLNEVFKDEKERENESQN